MESESVADRATPSRRGGAGRGARRPTRTGTRTRTLRTRSRGRSSSAPALNWRVFVRRRASRRRERRRTRRREAHRDAAERAASAENDRSFRLLSEPALDALFGVGSGRGPSAAPDPDAPNTDPNAKAKSRRAPRHSDFYPSADTARSGASANFFPADAPGPVPEWASVGEEEEERAPDAAAAAEQGVDYDYDYAASEDYATGVILDPPRRLAPGPAPPYDYGAAAPDYDDDEKNGTASAKTLDDELAGIVAASERGVGGVEDSLAAARVIAGAEGDDDAEYEAAKSGGWKKAEKAREEFPGAAARARARARARLGRRATPSDPGRRRRRPSPREPRGRSLGDAPSSPAAIRFSPRELGPARGDGGASRGGEGSRARRGPPLGAAAAAEAPRSSALFHGAPAARGRRARRGGGPWRCGASRVVCPATRRLASSAERAPLVAVGGASPSGGGGAAAGRARRRWRGTRSRPSPARRGRRRRRRGGSATWGTRSTITRERGRSTRRRREEDRGEARRRRTVCRQEYW